jgi:hypothetical protein
VAHRVGELERPPGERRLPEPDPGGAAVVQRARPGVRPRAELAEERDPQPLVRADRRVAPALVERGEHQLAAGRLVGRLQLGEPLEVAAAA